MEYTAEEFLKIPKKPRYKFVYKILSDFIDETIDYPINLMHICQKNKWKLIPYNTSFNYDIASVLSDGFSFIRNGEIYIFFNSMQINERINFTIAHEIGHIVLGHHLTNGVLSHNGLIENKAMETEANVFARNLLAPAPLLYDLELLPSVDTSARTFAVSKHFMDIRYNYLYDDYTSIKYNAKVVKKFATYTTTLNSKFTNCISCNCSW